MPLKGLGASAKFFRLNRSLDPGGNGTLWDSIGVDRDSAGFSEYRGSASSFGDAHQCCSFRIVRVAGNRSVLDPIDSFVDQEQRYKEPPARDHGLSKTILDLDIEPRGVKDAMDEILQLGAVAESETERRDRVRRPLRRPCPSLKCPAKKPRAMPRSKICSLPS